MTQLGAKNYKTHSMKIADIVHLIDPELDYPFKNPGLDLGAYYRSRTGSWGVDRSRTDTEWKAGPCAAQLSLSRMCILDVQPGQAG